MTYFSWFPETPGMALNIATAASFSILGRKASDSAAEEPFRMAEISSGSS